MVWADLDRFVPGRQLDDDGNVLMGFAGGGRGVIIASQVTVGDENGLFLRVTALAGKFPDLRGMARMACAPNSPRTLKASSWRHPGEDLHDGVAFERFLEAVDVHAHATDGSDTETAAAGARTSPVVLDML